MEIRNMFGKQPLLLRILVYFLLVSGSIVFSLPFVWMVCTSVKVDRELFPEKLTIFPKTPNAIEQSPYVDREYYKDAVKESQNEYIDVFSKIIRKSGFALPEHVHQERLVREMAKGLVKRFNTILPPDVWEQGAGVVEQKAENMVNEEMLRGILENVYRRLLFGQIRIRDHNVEEEELLPGAPFVERYDVLTPETARLVETYDTGTSCALVKYDFTRGNTVRIEQTCSTTIDLRNLHRIQLYFRPDDNWHRLTCYIEKMGKLYKSVRPFYMGNFEWGILTYQEPGPEDKSNKIKTWTLIKEIAQGDSYVHDPHKIKISFELKKSSQIQAWIGKLIRNYQITLDHIPIWRYTATSLYLVILNVALSVFSCSLVAYAIARLNWPGRNFCFLLMLATMMVPWQVTMIPSFLIWKRLGAYNTLIPLWLGSAFAAPFSVFLLRQFLKGIPKDLEEAARIDGCSYFQIYWHIMLPLVKPTLAVIAIGAFLGAWNNFMGPLIYVADQRLYPLAFGLFAFGVQVGNHPALTMSGAFIMTVPIIVAFFFAQRYFIQGVTLTGIKG
ncbi:carbohydrate ABC transporter permease [Candidatus Sumerlaeota bacterium]|nr:carbohydrate ABC transporter permease [Candidatus Sumerlaeota bacterium]